MIGPWTSSKKIVQARLPTRHPTTYPWPPHFSPPIPGQRLDVGRVELYAAMARTALTSSAPINMIQGQIDAAAAVIDYCIEEGTTGFELSTDFSHLNGSERTALAGRLGAGLCDLFMVSMKYVWRDQADRIITTREPLADFVYEGPPVEPHGVALAEAKGSTRQGTQTATQKKADEAYERQVASYIGAATRVGQVVQGYAVSFRSPIGKPGYLCVAETGGPPTAAGPAGEAGLTGQSVASSGWVSASTAYGNFAAALRLIGAERSATLLRAALIDRSARAGAIDGLKKLLEDSDGDYVMGPVHGSFFPYFGTQFGIRPEPLVVLIEHLFRSRLGDPADAKLELPIFASSDRARSEDDFVQFPDGLAAFSVSREEALATEASRPPEIPSQELHKAPGGLMSSRTLPREKYKWESVEEETKAVPKPALRYESNQ